MDAKRKRILLAVDGSHQAFDAIEYVSKILPASRSEVLLFHVMTRVPETFWDLARDPAWQHRIEVVKNWEKEQEARIGEFMQRARRVFLEAGFPGDAVAVAIRERKEGVARDIARESRHGYDAVMVGRRGLSTVKDLVLGGIAGKLIGKLTDITVWLVGGVPEVGRILIAMDPSAGAMAAVEHVGRMIDSQPFDVTLIHIVRGIAVPLQGFEAIFPEDYRNRLLEEAENAIKPTFDQATRRLVDAGVDPGRISRKVITGVNSRAAAIVDEAGKGGYGTIVVGRRGLSRVMEFDMGRVANKITHMARGMAVWVVG